MKRHHGATGEHAERTRSLAQQLAPEPGLDRDAVLLHDVGKTCVPNRILDKAGGLNEFEWMVMRSHPEAGAGMLSGVAGLGRFSFAVLAHHERYDGLGSPGWRASPARGSR